MRPTKSILAALIASVLAVPSAAAAAPPGQTAQPNGKAAAHAFTDVTLVTGDRLSVATDGSHRVVVRPTTGRSGIRFLSRVVKGHLHVIPLDAVPLLHAGRLDPRLFDVTSLLAYGYDDRRGDLPLIVSYAQGTATARRAAAPGTSLGRELAAVNGVSVRQHRGQATAFWNSITTSQANARSLADGVRKVWLDGKRQPTLDVSVPQIGAPQAWAAGYTGAAVPVGVVDTGVDDTHPDLAGTVVAAENFTEDGSPLDLVGHGTHVASTIAGSGAASGGTYKGVAPGAKLYSAKVCVLDGCMESWMIAGMQWAAAQQHVKVVNLSIGGGDTAEIDPVEEAVNTLTAQEGTLFVISAGNNGADGGVSSPSTADAALSVGAVTKTEELADFSNRGPRAGDSAIKPDITAPGVDIVAARGKDGVIGEPTGPDNKYLRLSGTSMAAPHVAGSAAIVAQQHPDWTPAELKASLMAAAKPNPAIGVYAQGAGRVDIARAVRQSITTSPVSVSFGLQAWPHTDDTPVTKTVTYQNQATTPLTLQLSLMVKGPDNGPVPAGMFTVSPSTVTVPAGGSAQASVTVDTRTGPEGYVGGELTATAGDVVVQTPVAVHNEVESYDVTVTNLDRAGAPSSSYDTVFIRQDQFGVNGAYDPSGTLKLRLPKGRYTVASLVFDDSARAVSELIQPVLEVDRARTVVMDARLAKPLSVTVPQRDATQLIADVEYTIPVLDSKFTLGLIGSTFEDFYTANVGPTTNLAGFAAVVAGQWAKVEGDGPTLNSPYQYHVAFTQPGPFITGFQKKVSRGELAAVTRAIAVDAAGAQAATATFPESDTIGGGFSAGLLYDIPGSFTMYVNTSPKDLRWRSLLEQMRPSTDPGSPFPETLAINFGAAQRYEAGRTYRETLSQAVKGPSTQDAVRWGDLVAFGPSMFTDAGHEFGFVPSAQGSATVYRDGVKLAEAPEPRIQFTAPAAPGTYRVTIDARRSTPFSLSTVSSATWTFRSAHVDGDVPQRLPISAVRFNPSLDVNNKAQGARLFLIPFDVEHQPGSSARTARTVDVKVSYDDGRTWTNAAVLRFGDSGMAFVYHPAGSGFASLKATAADDAGNKVEQTIIHAYRY